MSHRDGEGDERGLARVCAWCGSEIDALPDPDATARGEPSHGICDRCAERLLASTRREPSTAPRSVAGGRQDSIAMARKPAIST